MSATPVPSRSVALALSLAFATMAGAADWPRFRGPGGLGVSPDSKPVPTTWSATKNIQWKTDLPGPGSSSPIVVGNRIFLTCWTGYGIDDGSPGNQDQLRLHLLCINRKDGAIRWTRELDPVLPEERYGGMFAQHGYATHTPVSDGRQVFAFFGKSGVVAYDMDGNQQWRTSAGTDLDRRGWGSASSPVLYKDKVIVTAGIESHSMVALDKKTGKEVWKQVAEGFGGTWGTPVIVKTGDHDEIVLAVPNEIWGLNPDNGKLVWYCEAIDSSSICASVVAQDGIVYAVAGRDGGSIAVRAGGNDDVTETHVLWKGRDRARITTPILHDGRLHWIRSSLAYCIDAKTGKSIYTERIGGDNDPSSGSSGGGRSRGGRGGDYSSPVAADGKMYQITRSGETIVIKLGEKFELASRNRIEGDTSDFSATPAISDGQLFIRSSRRLYCIAE